MSAAVGKYAEKVTDTTAATTTWVDVCEIAADQFVAGKKYLIQVLAYVSCNSSSAEARVRLVHGTTPTAFTDSSAAYELKTVNPNKTCYGFMVVWDQPGTAELIKLQISNSATSTTTCHLGQIFALKLSDDFTENTDWFYTELLTDYTTTVNLGDTSASEAASVTFTPNGTDDYLILGNFYLTPAATASSYMASLFDSVEGLDQPFVQIEGEDIANENRSHLLARTFTPSNAAHTFQMRFAHETTAHTIKSSRVFALRLNKFAQHAFAYLATDETPAVTPSWTTTRTLAPTPSVTGDWFILGSFGYDIADEAANALGVRLQINPSGGGLVSNPAYGDDAPQGDGWDPTDETPFAIFTLDSLSSGASRAINLDTSITLGSAGAVQHRHLVAFSLELAAGGVTVAPSPAAAIGRGVAPTVVLGSLVIAPTARSAIGRVVTPTVVLGSLALTPAARSAIARVVAPAVVLGSLALAPSPAAAIGRVIAPGVELGSVVATPGPAQAIGRTVGPVVVLGSLAVTPAPASAIGRVVAPTVEISGGAGPSPVRRRLRWIYMHWRRFSRWT